MNKKIWMAGTCLILLAGIGAYAAWKHFSSPIAAPPSPTPEEMARYLQQRGENFYKERYYGPVIALYQKLLAQAPNDPEIKKKLASAYFGAGQYEKVKKLLREVEKTQSADAEVFYELGEIAYQEQEFSKAKQYALRALTQDPRHKGAKSLSKILEPK